jgi:hypothetical protein
MRTVRPETTDAVPRMGTSTTGGMRAVRSDTTGGTPRIDAVTSGPINRMGTSTSGSMRAVRIDPVVPPTARPRSRWLVALSTVGVLVLLAVCGLSTYFVVKDERLGASENQQNDGAAAQAQPRDITNRDSDPDPLTEAEVFPAAQIAGVSGGLTYEILKRQTVTDCTQAATDDLGALMNSHGCNQVVRATLKTADGVYLVTAGIFNLKDDQGAVDTHENIKPTIDAQKGRFTGLLAGTGTEVLVRAPMILGWHARGHYLAYCIIARADGKGFDESEQTVTNQIQADILTTHLRDGIIGARAQPKQPESSASTGASPAPSAS